jgi:tryptophan-rich sensory protein
MKNWQKALISIVGCEAVGLLGTPFTLNAIPDWYMYLNKPFFAPPNWLFGPAWTLLYFLMGVAIYRIWITKPSKKTKEAINYFLAQLSLNFIWTPIFFGLRSPVIGLAVIISMWFMILFTIKKFVSVDKLAGYLLLPYLAWVTFATMLNAAIVILN